MDASHITFKWIQSVQAALIEARIDTREQILPILDRLRSACGDAICGHPMVIFHGGAVKEGLLVEAGFPVTRPVESEEIHTRLLDSVPAVTVIHVGSHKTIRESVLSLYAHIEKHACSGSSIRREIYPVLNEAEPVKNITEVQIVIHEWDRLLAEGAEKV